MKLFIWTTAALVTASPTVAHEAAPATHLHPHGIGTAVLCGIVLLALSSHLILRGRGSELTAG